MEINLTGIVVVVGNYGSGKTEVCINLAVNRKLGGVDVRIADLDLVNPYFRTREARGPLSELGIEVVLPPKEYLQADLPILSPRVKGMIRHPSQLALLDVGGDDVGAAILATLEDDLKGKPLRVLQVINPLRPFTETVEGCLKVRQQIEKASRLSVDGIIGNANLIDETTADDIYNGYDFVNGLCESSGLPLEFITVSRELLSVVDSRQFACPLLVIERQLVPPWQKPIPLGKTRPP
ncbi:MAG: cobalamin biosynthesis protein CbiA, partial [Desulfobacterales bacterium]